MVTVREKWSGCAGGSLEQEEGANQPSAPGWTCHDRPQGVLLQSFVPSLPKNRSGMKFVVFEACRWAPALGGPVERQRRRGVFCHSKGGRGKPPRPSYLLLARISRGRLVAQSLATAHDLSCDGSRLQSERLGPCYGQPVFSNRLFSGSPTV